MIIDIGAQTGSVAKGEGQITALPLKLKDYQKVLQFLSKSLVEPVNEKSQVETIAAGMTILGTEGLSEIFSEIFPVYIKTLTGLQLQEDGQLRDMKLEDLWTYGSLTPIGLEALMFIFSISNLTDGDKKK